MRIDTSSISKPVDLNKPTETGPKVNSAEQKSDAQVQLRNHFVRERRKENRRITGDERRRHGRRQGEVRDQPASSPYSAFKKLDEQPTQGPARMVDIDC